MNKNIDRFITVLKTQLRLYLSISFGVFLFVLFFQPFVLDRFDFNNKLLFVAGLGAIVFLFMMIRIIIQWPETVKKQEKGDLVMPSYLGDFIILTLNSAAFTFFLKFVGYVSITFYVVFKLGLISLAPLVIVRIYEAFRDLKYRNESLIKHQIDLQKKMEKYEDNLLNKSIELISENRNENLKFRIEDIAFMRSADNYVEIIHREREILKTVLIRSTLKNIEQQIKPYSNFIRCHRTCIVNTHYIDKLHQKFGNYWLSLNGFDEQIPVSRQYLLMVREIL